MSKNPISRVLFVEDRVTNIDEYIEELEEEIAQLHGKEKGLIFSS